MGFDSIFFLSCFMPIALILYYAVPGLKSKNVALAVLSLVFYAFGSISALALLLAAWLGNYLLGLLLQRKIAPKAVVILGVSANLTYLFAFKYLQFVLGDVLGMPVGNLGLAAPLGMSFFLFKSISYLVDVYRNPAEGTKNPLKLLLYLSFFPQVTAGPISRFGQFAAQLDSRSIESRAAAWGLRRFLVGLGKKAVLCGSLAALVDGIFAESALGDIRLAWLGALGYMLQIYLDFSGYSDMAIGLGQMLGFATPENFRYPYIADSVGDFWRRWHLSLSTWFKDYLYIPLGGNRRGKFRAGVNKAIVFALCGLWHGANWTFLLWGLWHGLFSALESWGFSPKKLGRVWGHIYALLVVCIGFVMFRAADVAQGFAVIGAMFGGFSFTAESTVLLHKLCTAETVTMLLIGVAACLPIVPRLQNSKLWKRYGTPVSFVICLFLLALCVLKLAAGGFTPFIYAQF